MTADHLSAPGDRRGAFRWPLKRTASDLEVSYRTLSPRASGCPKRCRPSAVGTDRAFTAHERVVWAAYLPAWSACAASSVPATGLSLRSPGRAKIFSRTRAAWCRLRRRSFSCGDSAGFAGAASFARWENILPSPVGRVVRAPVLRSACCPERREAHAPPGRPIQIYVQALMPARCRYQPKAGRTRACWCRSLV